MTRESNRSTSSDFVKQAATKLRKMRNGKSVYYVAKVTGLSPKTILRMESGEGDYRILSLNRICEYYGITLYDFLTEIDERNE